MFWLRAPVESLSSVHSSSTVAELPRWMAIARAVSAKFKPFLFLVIKSYSVVLVFRSSVIPRFPVSRIHPARLSISILFTFLRKAHIRIVFVMSTFVIVAARGQFRPSTQPGRSCSLANIIEVYIVPHV